MISASEVDRNILYQHLLESPAIPVSAESKSWAGVRDIASHAHHDLYQFDHFWGGTGQYHINGQAYTMQENAFFLCCPGDEHAIEVPAGEDTRSFGVKFKLPPLGEGDHTDFLRFDNVFTVEISDQATLVQLLRKVVGYTILGDNENRIYASNALRELLVLLMRLKYKRHLHPVEACSIKANRVERILNYLRRNIDREVCLDELSRHIGLSRFHLARVFTQKTGKTPHQAFIEMKLDRARSLVLDTDIPVKEIAGRIGIKKPAYFSLIFKKRFGAMPRQMRRNVHQCI